MSSSLWTSTLWLQKYAKRGRFQAGSNDSGHIIKRAKIKAWRVRSGSLGCECFNESGDLPLEFDFYRFELLRALVW